MRKNVKSLAPTLWIVIAAFVIAIFAVWGGAGRLGEARTASTLASVGKEKISADLYYQNLRERLESLKEEFKQLDRNLIQQLNIPQQVLEQIIQQILLLQVAEDMGIEATNEEIQDRIKTVFQRDGKFVGFEEYKRILNWNRIPISAFEESTRKEIVIKKLIDVVTSGISVTPEEVWKDYKNGNESAKLEYVVLETNTIPLEQEPSPDEIQEHFEQNKEKYKIPEERQGSLVFFKTDDLKKDITLTEAEIEKYYKDNLSQFQEPEAVKVSRIFLPFEGKEQDLVRAEAQNILEKTKSGEDFGELAKKYSKDKKAAEGGEWGLYEWNTLAPIEQEEIERLSEGDVSEILELNDGVSILKVGEKKPPSTRPLEQVKERIKSILEDQEARQLAEEKVKNLEKSARKEKSLAAAAQQSGFEVKGTGHLKEGEVLPDIDSSGVIGTTLFELQEKQISAPLYTYRGVGIVQLEKIEPPRLANLEEVENEVKEELKALKKNEEALDIMKKVRSELKTTGLEKLAEKYKLEYRTVEEHKRGQYLSIVGENSKIDEQAFSLPFNEGSEPITFDGGFALIKVLNRKEVTPEDFEKEKEAEKEKLLDAQKNKFFYSLMMKWRKEKGVKIKYDLFLKINSDVLSRYAGQE